jgi:hypothetical protein
MMNRWNLANQKLPLLDISDILENQSNEREKQNQDHPEYS